MVMQNLYSIWSELALVVLPSLKSVELASMWRTGRIFQMVSTMKNYTVSFLIRGGYMDGST